MIYSAPSYLTGLVTDATSQILSEIQKNYGDNVTAFKFNTKFNGLVRTWSEDFNDYGGTVWGIDTSGRRITLFDQFRHGYNGVMKLSPEEDLKSTKTINLKGGTEIIIAFQYSGDETDYLADGSSKFAQDYFAWVNMYKYLGNELQEVLSYECS